MILVLAILGSFTVIVLGSFALTACVVTKAVRPAFSKRRQTLLDAYAETEKTAALSDYDTVRETARSRLIEIRSLLMDLDKEEAEQEHFAERRRR